jgi:hypothetical protein
VEALAGARRRRRQQGEPWRAGSRARNFEDGALEADGTIDTMKLQPISPLANFSFNYQDFLFTPIAGPPAKE